MNLENIKSTTTWAEASGTMNNNNAKITEAIERLESAVEEGGGGGTADSVAWNKVTGKPSWITDSKPVYAKEDLSQGVQTSLDKADTALQDIPDGYATEEYTQNQVRHILNLVSTALEGKVDKVEGKQLSTEDFTTALKEKLEALSSSGGVDREELQELSDRLELIVSGGASGVIDSFADIVAFLTGINDSVKLKDMLDTLRESILRKQDAVEDLDAIRSGASLGTTAVQRGESVEHAVSADSAAFATDATNASYISGNTAPKTTLEGALYSQIRYDYCIFNGTEGMFLAKNNANSMLTFSRYSGKYYSQLGLSSNGKLYYRVNKDQQDLEVSDVWKELAFTSSKVESAANADSAENAKTAQLSDKSVLLQGDDSDDFSGTDLEHNMKLFSGVSSSAEGLFPYGSNANAVLTINKHRGNYNSQLGFSSNGLLYYRNGSNAVLTTQPWKQLAFTDTKVDAAVAADSADTLNGFYASSLFKLENATLISSGSLNDYVNVGTYSCYSDATASSLSNCPVKNGFRLVVSKPLNNEYLLQELTAYWGTVEYSRCRYNTGYWSPWEKRSANLDSFNAASATKADKIETTEWIVGSHSSAPFVIRSLTYGDNVITCNHEGKVGIGTTNLTHTLTVNGTASISGDVSIGGTLTLRDVRMSDVLAIRMGVGTTISEDYALSVGGDVSVSGYVMTEGVSMYSQRSLKDVVDEDGLSLEELATIKPTRFTWKDGRDGRVHIGGIADDVQKVLPEAVRETPEGILTMDYPVASFAVASSLVKPVTNHEERIAELERENKQLREELEMIKRYIGYGNDK